MKVFESYETAHKELSIIKTKCDAEMMTNDEIDVWIAFKSTGEIISGHCSCKAG